MIINWLVAVIFFFSLSFSRLFLYVVCECVPSVIFPVQRTTSRVGDRPNRHNVRTTTTTTIYADVDNVVLSELCVIVVVVVNGSLIDQSF